MFHWAMTSMDSPYDTHGYGGRERDDRYAPTRYGEVRVEIEDETRERNSLVASPSLVCNYVSMEFKNKKYVLYHTACISSL